MPGRGPGYIRRVPKRGRVKEIVGQKISGGTNWSCQDVLDHRSIMDQPILGVVTGTFVSANLEDDQTGCVNRSRRKINRISC